MLTYLPIIQLKWDFQTSAPPSSLSSLVLPSRTSTAVCRHLFNQLLSQLIAHSVLSGQEKPTSAEFNKLASALDIKQSVCKIYHALISF
jgi:hypothetical protein